MRNQVREGGSVKRLSVAVVVDGTYKTEGSQVVVTIGGQSIVLTVDDHGCLTGGQLIGTYCKQ